MASDGIFNDLLATLYAAPMSPELWPESPLGLADMLGLNASAIVHTDPTCKANSLNGFGYLDNDRLVWV